MEECLGMYIFYEKLKCFSITGSMPFQLSHRLLYGQSPFSRHFNAIYSSHYSINNHLGKPKTDLVVMSGIGIQQYARVRSGKKVPNEFWEFEKIRTKVTVETNLNNLPLRTLSNWYRYTSRLSWCKITKSVI